MAVIGRYVDETLHPSTLLLVLVYEMIMMIIMSAYTHNIHTRGGWGVGGGG